MADDESTLNINIADIMPRAYDFAKNDESGFIVGVVDTIAHQLADHTEPAQLLSERDHDIMKLTVALAVLLFIEMEDGHE